MSLETRIAVGIDVSKRYLDVFHAGAETHHQFANDSKGIGALMCQHSQDEAVSRGFRAMQFNLVAASNEGAVGLWKKMGFEIVGTLPGAFRHPRLGFVDAHVMYKLLRKGETPGP